MNDSEAYKIGYMMRCASRGMEPTQMHEHLQKQATTGAAIHTIWDAIKYLAPRAGLAAVVAPPIAGMAAGYGLSQLSHPDYDVDQVKHEERLRALQAATSELARAQRQMPTLPRPVK